MSKKSLPKKKTILILDDEDKFPKSLRDKLLKLPAVAKGFAPIACEKDELIRGLCVLEGRQQAIREGRSSPADPTCFDTADVLVVDYDLADLYSEILDKGSHSPLGAPTGERVAYLARCFSTCGFIIALNQYNRQGQPVFDLTLLGHVDSFADLNIGDRELTNAGLWTHKWKDYRPWHWPVLSDAIDSFEQRTKKLRGAALDSPIFKHLGLSRDLVNVIPQEVLQWLAPWCASVEDVAKVTFAEFLTKSKQGLEVKDKNVKDSAYAPRVASARIGKWLERLVLSGQGILIDAPHLVARFPSILKTKPTLSNLDATCMIGRKAKPPLNERYIEKHRFRAADWLSRPAWFWESVRANNDIPEVKEPWKRETLDSRFCEDVSAFVLESKCTEFVADTPGTYNRRFVKRLEPRVAYSPEMKFAL